MNSNLNIHEEFKKISEKLKKRMFRKVPFAQVAQQFVQLSLAMQRNGQTHYRALCLLSAAECEEQNEVSDIHAAYFFLSAGRIFCATALDEQEIYYFTSEEFISESIQAFSNAIDIYETYREYSICATLSYELAKSLKSLKQWDESARFFMQSHHYSSLQQNHLYSQIDSLKNAIDCYIQVKDFETAMERLKNWMQLTQLEHSKHSQQVIIFESFVESKINLLFIYLLTKRKTEAEDLLKNQLLQETETQLQLKSVFLNFYRKVLKSSLNDLVECCNLDDVASLKFLISNELKHNGGLSALQHSLIDYILHVYQNPIHLNYLQQKHQS